MTTQASGVRTRTASRRVRWSAEPLLCRLRGRCQRAGQRL